MFPQVVRSGLTLPKILTGINKTLTVANQIIPIYVQAKPMIQNAKTALGVAREFLNKNKNNNNNNSQTYSTQKTNKNQNQMTVKSSYKQDLSSTPLSSSNSTRPTFFL